MMANEEVRDAQTLFDCFDEVDKYKCKTCPHFYTESLARLRSHIREGHRDETFKEYVYKCSKCLSVTHSKFVMGRHSLFSECATNNEDERRKRFLCCRTATDTHFRSSNNLKRAEVRDAQTLFDCLDEIDKYKCKTCPNFQTDSLARLKSHIRDGHQDGNVVEYVYKCLKCFFVTNSKYLMGRHSLYSECATDDEDEQQRRFLCYQTSKQANFRLNDEPKTTLCGKSEINQFQCEQCNSKFKRRYCLKRHIRLCHSKPKDIRRFECEECLLKFKRKTYLARHRKLCHSKPEDIRWFQCEQCSYKCKSKTNLKMHFQARHANSEDIRWFQCEQCSYKCTRKGNLKRHFQSRHANPEDINWHQCEQCSSKFKERGQLAKHIQLMHSNPEDIKWYQCEECSSKFKTKSHLARHRKFCHSKPENIRWFQCEQCSYKCKKRTSLKVHFQLRHADPADVDWHRCEQCSYKCKVKSDLKKHFQARHVKPEDINWHRCEQCSSKFKQRGSLLKHIQRIHGKH